MGHVMTGLGVRTQPSPFELGPADKVPRMRWLACAKETFWLGVIRLKDTARYIKSWGTVIQGPLI